MKYVITLPFCQQILHSLVRISKKQKKAAAYPHFDVMDGMFVPTYLSNSGYEVDPAATHQAMMHILWCRSNCCVKRLKRQVQT